MSEKDEGSKSMFRHAVVSHSSSVEYLREHALFRASDQMEIGPEDGDGQIRQLRRPENEKRDFIYEMVRDNPKKSNSESLLHHPIVGAIPVHENVRILRAEDEIDDLTRQSRRECVKGRYILISSQSVNASGYLSHCVPAKEAGQIRNSADSE